MYLLCIVYKQLYVWQFVIYVAYKTDALIKKPTYDSVSLMKQEKKNLKINAVGKTEQYGKNLVKCIPYL